MLQGSSNQILMSKINGRCNLFFPILFTYYFEWRLFDCSCLFVFKVWNTSLIFCPPSRAIFFAPSWACAVSILNGAPSSALVYFLYKGWYSIKNYIYHLQLKEFSRSTPSYAVIHLNGAPSSTPVILFRVGKVGIASGFISIIYSFEGVFSLHTIVCSYSYERCPIERTSYFYLGNQYTSIYCSENFLVKIYCFCYPSCAHLSAPSCAILLIGAPSSAPVYFY